MADISSIAGLDRDIVELKKEIAVFKSETFNFEKLTVERLKNITQLQQKNYDDLTKSIENMLLEVTKGTEKSTATLTKLLHESYITESTVLKMQKEDTDSLKSSITNAYIANIDGKISTLKSLMHYLFLGFFGALSMGLWLYTNVIHSVKQTEIVHTEQRAYTEGYDRHNSEANDYTHVEEPAK